MYIYSDIDEYSSYNLVKLYKIPHEEGEKSEAWKDISITELESFLFPNNTINYCSTYFVYSDIQPSSRSDIRKGSVVSYFFPIDIDDKKDLQKAYNTTNNIINHLYELFGILPQWLDLYFSGSKGFHIEIPAILFGGFRPKMNYREEFRAIFNYLELYTFTEGSTTIDDSIYKSTQQSRLPNTLNTKGNLYKIQLSYIQFLQGLEFIKIMAQKPQKIERVNISNLLPLESLLDIRHKITLDYEDKALKRKNKASQSRLEWEQMSKKGVSEGNRNNYHTKLAFKNRDVGGLDKEASLDILLKQNKLNDPPDTDIKQIERTNESVYKYHRDYRDSAIFKWYRHDDYISSLKKPIHIYFYTTLCMYCTQSKQTTRYGLELEPNMNLVSTRQIQRDWKINESTARYLLKKFEKEGAISIQTTKNYTLIKHLKFDKTKY